MRLAKVSLLVMIIAYVGFSVQAHAQQTEDGKVEPPTSTQNQSDDMPSEAQGDELANKETINDPTFRPSEEISEDTPVPFPIDI
ncbi:MAG: hypothetical protein MK188_05035 [Gammaproteobacteria bacterium]|nr:hypothetical protein [Gammaproteobacteria bacterium]